jgi:tetratricopeptide (TPR) repeat protein
MIRALTNNRLLMALRLAFYPAFETADAKRFQALTRAVQDARNAGNLAEAEELYLRALNASFDRSHLKHIRYGLANVYQEQQKYREAELIYREQLEEAVSSTEVHAAHMGLARLYREEGEIAKAEEHYIAALAETQKPELSSDREMYCLAALLLARFYVEQHRYADAEPLFKRFLENREANRASDSSFPHYLLEFAKIYEGQEKYEAAEELYRRALKICEEVGKPEDFSIVRALDDFAAFCRARGRYAEAEELARRSLALVEEKMRSQTDPDTKGLHRSNSEAVEARIRHARIPISAALDQLAEIYESQDKYAESEPLRRRSFEIKHQAYGERIGWVWVDSLAAYANVLHKLGREDEAAKLDERAEAIRAKYPSGSVRSFVRLTSRPMKRTLRGRFSAFMNALLHPSPR